MRSPRRASSGCESKERNREALPSFARQRVVDPVTAAPHRSMVLLVLPRGTGTQSLINEGLGIVLRRGKVLRNASVDGCSEDSGWPGGDLG